MRNEPKKYTVEITKNDGMRSTYYVIALSAGGAEETCLREVYAAKWALAKENWPTSVTKPDLFSRGAAIFAINQICIRNVK